MDWLAAGVGVVGGGGLGAVASYFIAPAAERKRLALEREKWEHDKSEETRKRQVALIAVAVEHAMGAVATLGTPHLLRDELTSGFRELHDFVNQLRTDSLPLIANFGAGPEGLGGSLLGASGELANLLDRISAADQPLNTPQRPVDLEELRINDALEPLLNAILALNKKLAELSG